MKNICRMSFILALSILFSGCSVLCIGGTGTCGLSADERHKLLHPKLFGEQWERKDTTKEIWRKDWIDYGGLKDGGYGRYYPTSVTSERWTADSREQRNSLAACMLRKSYTYTGQCYDNDIGRGSLACQGKVLTPLP